MSALNLSDWALKHRSFIVFIMAAVTVAGIASFFSLGRAEDPPFTFRTMIVQARWPGATMDDTLSQVTERLERKLQETKGLDFLRSYTIPGQTTIFVNLKGSTSAKGSAGHLVSGAQEYRRHPRHAAGRRGRPRLQRRLRRHVRIDLRLHRRRLHPARAARLRRGHSIAPLTGSGCVEDRAPRRAGRADLCRVFDPGAGRPRH